MKMAIERILVGDRVRPLRQPTVDIYAEAMAARGELDQAITVRPLSDPVGIRDHRLVAGGHRLAAAEQIGWSDIEVVVKHYASDDAARLAQIDENLQREELTPLDRAIFLAERKGVWEEIHPGPNGAATVGRRRPEATKRQSLPFGFSREAAEAIGLSERTIRDAVLVAALGPDAERLRRAPSTATGASELRNCQARCGKARQVVERLAAGEGVSPAPSRPPALSGRRSTHRSSSTGRWSRCGAAPTPGPGSASSPTQGGGR